MLNNLEPTWQQGETTRSCVLLTHARVPIINTWRCMHMCIDCSNVTQTLPHGSYYRRFRSQGSVRRMLCSGAEIRSTQMPIQNLRMPVKIAPTLTSTKVFGSRPLPAEYLSPYAQSLIVSSVDRSLLPAPAVQGPTTPDSCLA